MSWHIVKWKFYYKTYQNDILMRLAYTNHLQCPFYISDIFWNWGKYLYNSNRGKADSLMNMFVYFFKFLFWFLYDTRRKKTAKFVFNGIKMNQQNKCLLAKMDILLWDRADIYRERMQDDASQQIIPIIIVSSKRR